MATKKERKRERKEKGVDRSRSDLYRVQVNRELQRLFLLKLRRVHKHPHNDAIAVQVIGVANYLYVSRVLCG